MSGNPVKNQRKKVCKSCCVRRLKNMTRRYVFLPVLPVLTSYKVGVIAPVYVD